MLGSGRWQQRRPCSCCDGEPAPSWDTAIRKYLHCDESADGYQSYLEQVGQLIKVLAAEAHVQISELPGLVGRPESSAAEVVDEALWDRCARKGQWKPPSAELLSTC